MEIPSLSGGPQSQEVEKAEDVKERSKNFNEIVKTSVFNGHSYVFSIFYFNFTSNHIQSVNFTPRSESTANIMDQIKFDVESLLLGTEQENKSTVKTCIYIEFHAVPYSKFASHRLFKQQVLQKFLQEIKYKLKHIPIFISEDVLILPGMRKFYMYATFAGLRVISEFGGGKRSLTKRVEDSYNLLISDEIQKGPEISLDIGLLPWKAPQGNFAPITAIEKAKSSTLCGYLSSIFFTKTVGYLEVLIETAQLITRNTEALILLYFAGGIYRLGVHKNCNRFSTVLIQQSTSYSENALERFKLSLVESQSKKKSSSRIRAYNPLTTNFLEESLGSMNRPLKNHDDAKNLQKKEKRKIKMSVGPLLKKKLNRTPAKSPYFPIQKKFKQSSINDLPKSPSKLHSQIVYKSSYFKISETGSILPREVSQNSSTGRAISCIPFPSLSSPYFGIIQEKLVDDPFRLLIAVTFLIRTHGKYAIPAFHMFITRYPTPESILAAKRQDIVSMICHLGFQNQRAHTFQLYASIYLKSPPTKGKRYAIRGYPTYDSGRDVKKGEILSDSDDREAWEIGHMTSGHYALDSWRIFCRDKLRGVAKGWNGEGAYEGFQPEWMRVLPQDRELKVFLQWMWLKEGFEWNPQTGEKNVANIQLLTAAMEQKVVWDDVNGLRIINDECV